ncbi:MAG TPA: hypothetical protein VHQ01_07165, partial [Pyrinomonadaceae bacterium]|nr:hypothetical protein [Pyrinomonadaceae bacterium]
MVLRIRISLSEDHRLPLYPLRKMGRFLGRWSSSWPRSFGEGKPANRYMRSVAIVGTHGAGIPLRTAKI